MPRHTHTLAELQLSASAYDEIAGKLREAGYDHAFGLGCDEGLIDMQGIGVTRDAAPSTHVGIPKTLLARVSYVSHEKKARGNYALTIGFLDLEAVQDFHQWIAEQSAKQAKADV